MKSISQLYLLTLSLILVFTSFPLLAIVENIEYIISEFETNKIKKNPDHKYIYLGQDLSDIITVISEISKFDNDHNSPLHQFKKHIDNGFSIGSYDAIIQVSEYAQNIIQKNYHLLDHRYADSLHAIITTIINQITNDTLTVNAA